MGRHRTKLKFATGTYILQINSAEVKPECLLCHRVDDSATFLGRVLGEALSTTRQPMLSKLNALVEKFGYDQTYESTAIQLILDCSSIVDCSSISDYISQKSASERQAVSLCHALHVDHRARN